MMRTEEGRYPCDSMKRIRSRSSESNERFPTNSVLPGGRRGIKERGEEGRGGESRSGGREEGKMNSCNEQSGDIKAC